MIELDVVWGSQRFVKINGKPIHIPFGVDLSPVLFGFITKWLRHSGTRFTVKRMKSLYVWAIHLLAGERGYSEVWFRKELYKGYTIPKLRIFRYLVDNICNKVIITKVLTVLKSYRLRVVDEPSLSAITGVTRSLPSDKYIPHLRRYVRLPIIPPSVLEREVAINTRTKFADDFGRTFSGPIGLKDEEYNASIALTWEEENDDPFTMGNLIPIQDKGKWRNILVGHWAVQLKCKKLADWLRRWLWKQPEVCSGDQQRFSDFCIQSLKEDKYMLSVDLSEATDRISKDLQIKLLTSMGVPSSYFRFLSLPFCYHGEHYGEPKGIKKARYSNGQPMGLYLSFPMFELAHYVLLKFVTAKYSADFRICGDDVVISCRQEDANDLLFRYRNILERFGGVISPTKTICSSKVSEGVGAIFLKDQGEIRVPSGKLSTLEGFTKGTWLYKEICSCSAIGRAVSYVWLSTKLTKEYSYEQRREANLFLVSYDLEALGIEALRSLSQADDRMPMTYYFWDEDYYNFWRMTLEDRVLNLKWVGQERFRDALVSNRIVHLYKE